jgi:hypothetical protein
VQIPAPMVTAMEGDDGSPAAGPVADETRRCRSGASQLHRTIATALDCERVSDAAFAATGDITGTMRTSATRNHKTEGGSPHGEGPPPPRSTTKVHHPQATPPTSTTLTSHHPRHRALL